MQLPAKLGTHLLQVGLRQATLGKHHHRERGAAPGLAKDGPIRGSPKAMQREQDPRNGPKMTRRERVNDGESDQQRPGV